MSYAMFGVPNQVYDVGLKYLADTTGKIADVPDINDRKALRDAGCIDENPIVAVTSTDAFGNPLVLTGQTSTPGAATGTLTNAPAAGDPQTWLQVSINGVMHWIPAWHA